MKSRLSFISFQLKKKIREMEKIRQSLLRYFLHLLLFQIFFLEFSDFFFLQLTTVLLGFGCW